MSDKSINLSEDVQTFLKLFFILEHIVRAQAICQLKKQLNLDNVWPLKIKKNNKLTVFVNLKSSSVGAFVQIGGDTPYCGTSSLDSVLDPGLEAAESGSIGLNESESPSKIMLFMKKCNKKFKNQYFKKTTKKFLKFEKKLLFYICLQHSRIENDALPPKSAKNFADDVQSRWNISLRDLTQ